MRTAARLRRLSSALLAALVLCASLASAAHSHAGATTHAPEIAVDAPQGTGAASADLDCALCAAAARLAHGAHAAFALPVALDASGCPAPHGLDAVPPRIDLAQREARAPPQLG